jgi:hypothetical protein
MKRRLLTFLVIFACFISTHCLAVEKKSMVLIVPANSKEIHAYEVFEGISVADDKNPQLERAKGEINALKEPKFSFFASGEKGSPVLKVCQFEKSRFFLHPDPACKRPLCMDRRITITDREQFFKLVNQSIMTDLAESARQQTDQEFLNEIKQFNAKAAKEKATDSTDALPALVAMLALVELLNDIDLNSVKRLRKSAKDDFRLLRVESGQILVVLPLSPECANQVAISPKTKVWLKDMRLFVTPIELRANDDGLAIVLGKQGQPIRFTHIDKRPIHAADENALTAYAGAASPIVIGGTAMTGERLIERFIAEKMRKK